jgi:hypothetical protein
LHLNTERALKQAMDVDESEEEIYKIKFATTFLLGVVIRSDQRLKFVSKILPQIRETAARSYIFSRWLVNCFNRKHTINEFFVNCWSTQACRIVASLLKVAIKKVHTEEKIEIKKVVKAMKAHGDQSPEAMVQYLQVYMNDPSTKSPITLR